MNSPILILCPISKCLDKFLLLVLLCSPILSVSFNLQWIRAPSRNFACFRDTVKDPAHHPKDLHNRNNQPKVKVGGQNLFLAMEKI